MYFSPPRCPFRPLPADRRSPSVAVVGGGPVGLATALGLAQRGCEVVLVEAGDSACHGSRAICVSRHSLEVLDRLGVADQVVKSAVSWTGGRSFYRDTEVLRFEMPHSQHDVFPPMVNVSQSRIEQVLIDAAAATDGVCVQWRSTVVECRSGEDRVDLKVDTPEGAMWLTADWVVAADGARSTVRELLGLTMSGTSYEGCYVIADIHWPTALPPERRVWFDAPSAPGSTLILHRQPDDIWRVDYQLAAEDDPEVEVQEERIRDRISRHFSWLGDDTPWSLEWTSIYRAHSLSLQRYRHDRVLFVGDAAHLVPIFGVRGLNSGLEDADALAWTLALVVHGRLDESVLDGWAEERRAAWEQNIAQADLSTRFMTPGTDGYQRTRDAVLALAAEREELRVLINPRQSSATHARGSSLTASPATEATGPRPGDPVADVPVTAPDTGADGPSTLFGLAGGRFAVISPAGAVHAGQVATELAAQVGVGNVATVERGVLDPAAAAASLGPDSDDILVLRPDGLVLARLAPGEHLGPFPRRDQAGPELTEQRTTTVTSDRDRELEQIWTRLSEAIDDVSAEQRVDVLTRLLLAVAVTSSTADEVAQAVDLVRRSADT